MHVAAGHQPPVGIEALGRRRRILNGGDAVFRQLAGQDRRKRRGQFGALQRDRRAALDAAARRTVLDRVIEEWGRLDVLVNNAGTLREAPLDDLTDEEDSACPTPVPASGRA